MSPAEETEVASERETARTVRDMFGKIAARYDFLNHFLSVNTDRLWRRRCLKEVRRRLSASPPRILDIGCGTADLSIAFSRLGPVFGCDFCHPMLRIGRQKVSRAAGRHAVELVEGDALNLSFRDGVFDAVVSAFVVRNLANIDAGLTEMRRVLRPGGVLAVLDFSMPTTPILGAAYRFYFLRVLPRLGKWLSGVDGPYRYLPDSVQTFPPPREFAGRIASAGFLGVEHHMLTRGVAALFLATAAPR